MLWSRVMVGQAARCKAGACLFPRRRWCSNHSGRKSLQDELNSQFEAKTTSDASDQRLKSGVRVARKTYQENFEAQAQELFRSGEKDVDPSQSGSKEEMKRIAAICVSVGFFVLGGTFLAVPLYKMYCTSAPQVGGGVNKYVDNIFEEASNKPSIASVIQVIFRSAVGTKNSPLMFVPLQNSIEALVGEPTLAFFNVYNRSDKTLIGISTYNVAPVEAAQYFNKIQCFCFEEQRIKPHELIEMPVFFFVDKEYLDDPGTAAISSILLNYTLFVV
ncbi:hypothetical protein DIPPA_70104 [Diplonema papillatum]|nr:hypothetical protein DIPPA_70104 [Diplonema papillatum]